MVAFYATIFCWKHHVQEAIEPLLFAHRLSLSCGDTECAMVCANMYCVCKLEVSPIPSLVKEIRGFRDCMCTYGQQMNLWTAQPFLYTLLHLSGETEGHFGALLTAEYDPGKDPNNAVYVWLCYAKMVVCYMFGDYEEACEHSKGCLELARHPSGGGERTAPCMFIHLTALARCRNKRSKWRAFRQAEHGIQRLRYWSRFAPLNVLGRLFLLEAELAWAKGDRASAYPLFLSAISLAREAGFLMVVSIAYERTGKYFLEVGDWESASPFLDKALTSYAEWGAYAKRDHLQAEIESTR